MKNTLLALSALLVLNPAFAAPVATPATMPVQTAEQNTQTELTRAQQTAYTAQNIKASEEERAAALRQLSLFPNQNSLVAVARALKESSPVIREAAIIGSEPYPTKDRWQMVSPLLSDESEQVRVTAAMNLLRNYDDLSATQLETLEPVVQELLTHLKAVDTPESQLLLADAYRFHREWPKADALYRSLLEKDQKNPTLWLNLAENERAQQKNQASMDVLNDGLKLLPENADLHYSKAMALVRLKQKQEAAKEMKKAATLAEGNSYYWYLDGVLQEAYDADDATKSFEQAYLISGAPEHLYAVCDVYARHQNPKTEQCLEELAKYAPKQAVDQIRQSMQ